MISTLAHVNRLLEGMVHGSVQEDRLLMLRHRQSLAAHLLTGLAGLAAIPAWLAFGGRISLAEIAAFAWLAMYLALAFHLSRAGNLQATHLLAAMAGAAFVVCLACLDGGIRSPILFCLALLPIETSLSGSRMVAGAGVLAAAIGLATIAIASGINIVPPAAPGVDVAAFAAAMLYAGGIVFRLQGFAGAAAHLCREDEERYRLFADHSVDLITRHAPNGDVCVASPNARRLTGAASADLLGDGLFHRVHVADRPAYLTALSEARSRRCETGAEFRLRCTEADGGPRFIQVSMRCRPVTDTDDAVIAVTRPLSGRAETEQESSNPVDVEPSAGLPIQLDPAATRAARLRRASMQAPHQPEERKSA